MKYHDGHTIKVGDTVNHNCGHDTGTVVLVAEILSDIQKYNYDGPTVLIKCHSKGLMAYGKDDIFIEQITLIKRS